MAIKTSIKWGYTLSDEQINLTRETFESWGYVFVTVRSNEEGYVIREWNTEQDATAYIELVNTFDPPPVSAEVIVE
jgi:hypothetical protein